MFDLPGSRLGVVGIVIEDKESVDQINKIMSDNANIIVGRMGIPYWEKEVRVISLIVDGTTDEIGALTGKLGSVPNVTVSSALAKNR